MPAVNPVLDFGDEVLFPDLSVTFENDSPAIIPVFFCAQSEEVNTKIISTIKRIIDLIVISFGF